MGRNARIVAGMGTRCLRSCGGFLNSHRIFCECPKVGRRRTKQVFGPRVRSAPSFQRFLQVASVVRACGSCAHLRDMRDDDAGPNAFHAVYFYGERKTLPSVSVFCCFLSDFLHAWRKNGGILSWTSWGNEKLRPYRVGDESEGRGGGVGVANHQSSPRFLRMFDDEGSGSLHLHRV